MICNTHYNTTTLYLGFEYPRRSRASPVNELKFTTGNIHQLFSLRKQQSINLAIGDNILNYESCLSGQVLFFQ